MSLCIPPPVRIFLPLFGKNIVTADGISSGDSFEAVEIGPSSEAAQCFVLHDGASWPAKNATASVGGLALDRDVVPANAFEIQNGEAYVGPVKGPVRVAPRGFRYSSASNHDSMFTTTATRANGGHDLELLFWPVAPHWFRRRRPDAHYLNVPATAYSGTVAETEILRAPAYGRRELLFSYEVLSLSAGTITLRIYGGRHVSGLADCIVETLLSTIALTAPAQANYEYEGKFDYYRVTMQAAGVTGMAASTSKVAILLKDPA
jgi:hypothetical protein